MLIDHLLLFASAFISATILPFSSEAFLYVMVQDARSPLVPVLVATTGNVLGACVNWWLGSGILRFRQRRWFYFNEGQINRAQRWFQRYGVWTLLLSWLPIVGDALTLIAGVMRVRFPLFVLLVTLGKMSRYVVIAWLAQ